jgi:glycosyltransferase involved in cell wall biosynthesis
MNKIRVGFDISQLAHTGGVATYTRNLAIELSKLPDLEMVYFYSSLRKKYAGSLKDIESYPIPPSILEPMLNILRIPIEKFIGEVDVFHSSDWIQPGSHAKKVTTYHDVVPLKYPEWSHPKIIKVHKRRLKLVEKEIDIAIAVSESTKKDLLEISSIPKDKIIVIYEGPTANFKSSSKDKIRKFKEKYNLPDKFILAIGGVGERRNIDRIKEAAKDYNLVIAGVTLPWLSTEELELLYNSAGALAYCSLYEGFGIPILDAFSVGLPVITSKVSSMPEVGGNAAVYVDPLKIDDIKEKLNMVLSDEKLRQDLIKKGFERVKQFSWEQAAEKTAQVYRRLVK